jgi:peptidyl-tRNA hydrolase
MPVARKMRATVTNLSAAAAAALQPTAAVRLRMKGGHGGHNGLRSIQQHFGGSQDFPRIKIGEGHVAVHSVLTGYIIGQHEVG